MMLVTPPSPELLREQTQRLLGAQLAPLIRPLFQSFEETPLLGDSPHGSFLVHVFSQEMANELVASEAFDPFVSEMCDSLTPHQGGVHD